MTAEPTASTDGRTATPEIANSLPTCGFATNYHDRGEGEPVLLIHGSGPGVSAWANWRLTLPVLAERHRVIAPDMVGFGYTQSPANVNYRLPLWVDQAFALLDGLGLDAVNVVGNSFGGAVALGMASRHPERVRRLVLMGSVGLSFPISPGLDQVWGYQPSPAAMRELLLLFAFDRTIITDDLVQMRYRASVRDDVQQRFGAMFPAPRQRWVDALALDEAALRAIVPPTLLIHGRDDRVIPLAVSERMLALIPRARLAIIERCGHWVQIEQADAFQAQLRGFFDTPVLPSAIPRPDFTSPTPES